MNFSIIKSSFDISILFLIASWIKMIKCNKKYSKFLYTKTGSLYQCCFLHHHLYTKMPQYHKSYWLSFYRRCSIYWEDSENQCYSLQDPYSEHEIIQLIIELLNLLLTQTFFNKNWKTGPPYWIIYLWKEPFVKINNLLHWYKSITSYNSVIINKLIFF